MGRFINRDPLEEQGGWNLYRNLNYATTNPYFGSSGLGSAGWLTEWSQKQDSLTRNASFSHSTEEIQFSNIRNSGFIGTYENNKKFYSANAGVTVGQGGSKGLEFDSPDLGRMTYTGSSSPGYRNKNSNLYAFVANNPINLYDPMGLASDDEDEMDEYELPALRVEASSEEDLFFMRGDGVEFRTDIPIDFDTQDFTVDLCLGSYGCSWPNDSSTYTISAHGTEYYLLDETGAIPVSRTPEEIAEMILRDPAFFGVQDVVLYACRVGMRDNGFAARLSELIGKPVYAPDGNLDALFNVRPPLPDGERNSPSNSMDYDKPDSGFRKFGN